MGSFLGQNAAGATPLAEAVRPSSARRVVVLGATSIVGKPLLEQLHLAGYEVLAVSRSASLGSSPGVAWVGPDAVTCAHLRNSLSRFDACPWICLAPIWVLGDYLEGPLALMPSRLIALSSTSRFSKEESVVSTERALAQRLATAEDKLMLWANARKLPWVILRPTLIHGYGRDRNVADIVRFVSRYGFFPILGQGKGLRRPVHASELAEACLQAVRHEEVAGIALTISGAETMSYADMVKRVFEMLGRRPRLIHIPRWVLQLALGLLHRVGIARHWSIGMADRMDQDLAYSSEEAQALLGLTFGKFRPDSHL